MGVREIRQKCTQALGRAVRYYCFSTLGLVGKRVEGDALGVVLGDKLVWRLVARHGWGRHRDGPADENLHRHLLQVVKNRKVDMLHL